VSIRSVSVVFCRVFQCVAACCAQISTYCIERLMDTTVSEIHISTCMLQCVAVCCSVLQCVAVCCSVLQCVAVCCSVLQCASCLCSVLFFYYLYCFAVC